ncbi:MAG: TonB-dependent receptor [Acidobacteriota bacterium]|nr:TonB-dependent receptor [Acidobacteriota bacterium]
MLSKARRLAATLVHLLQSLPCSAGRLAALLLLLSLGTAAGHAVVVRGVVRDPLGAPVMGARVQLIYGPNVAAAVITGADGSYEIRSAEPGRFVLLTSAPSFTPGISEDFYGGRTDVVVRNITLEVASVTEQVSVTATGLPTPLQQLSSSVTLFAAQDLGNQVGINDTLRQSPGVAVVQTGQYGGVTSLFVRGGNSTANKVLLDGIPVEDIGGVFDYSSVSSTAVHSMELYRGPDSVLYGADAGAGVVSINTPRGNSLRPVLNYLGSGGNLHSYRNLADLSGAWRKTDYYLSFSRFNSANALPRDEYHAVTSAANLGYNLSGNTQLRLTLRNADNANGLPGAHDFYGISADGKQGDQDLYSGLTLEDRRAGNWHNVFRYGIARKREQEQQFNNVGTPVTYNFGTPFTEYFGNTVTIQGANGYSATGQASFFIPNEKSVSNRDEFSYQTDYALPYHVMALGGFWYENERGSFVTSYSNETIQRTNYQVSLQFQGDIRNRLFYSLGGAIQKNHLYGITGTPRLGLAWVPVRPAAGWFRGTKVRGNVATGVQEPSLALEFASLYTQLLQAGDTADIALYHVSPAGPERSRTYDLGIDQNILGEKLIFKLGYFHNIFDHQMEGVDTGALEQVFGFSPAVVTTVYTPYLNSLAFRAQGIEAEVQYQPLRSLFLHAGYSYLDAVVLHSFTSDAYNNGAYNPNPNLPGIAIGAEGPLVGARPFRRPPHTGFFSAQYTASKFTAALTGALASRSDDSTFLDGFDMNFGNSLVLPNRNLDYGYAKLDTSLTYAATRRITVFTQLNNLLNQQHIGPIGYPSLPFTVQAGLKVRLAGFKQ